MCNILKGHAVHANKFDWLLFRFKIFISFSGQILILLIFPLRYLCLLQILIQMCKVYQILKCVCEVFHVTLLIWFGPTTSEDTCRILTFPFSEYIKFSDVALNICKEILKCTVNFTHFNLYFKQKYTLRRYDKIWKLIWRSRLVDSIYKDEIVIEFLACGKSSDKNHFAHDPCSNLEQTCCIELVYAASCTCNPTTQC